MGEINNMTERYNVQASTILGENYKITNIECSDYNPSIDDYITVTITVNDVYGDSVEGENVTVTASEGNFTQYNGSTITGASSYTGTTNSSGQFTLTYACSEWGLITFSANTTSTQIRVIGWRIVSNNQYEKVQYNEDTAQVIIHTESIVFGTSWSVQSANILGSAKSLIKPSMPVISLNSSNSLTALSIKEDGELWKKSYTDSSVTTGAYCILEWHY